MNLPESNKLGNKLQRKIQENSLKYQETSPFSN